MIETELIPNQIIDDEQLYNQAISLIIARAQNQLLIFDQDLRYGDFSSITKYQLLKKFLSANIASEVTIILQDAEYFQQKCPRLNELFKVYQHRFKVCVTNSSMKNIKQCFIVADGEHYIKRIHIDQARFRYAFNDKLSGEILHNKFLELMAAKEKNISSSILGL